MDRLQRRGRSCRTALYFVVLEATQNAAKHASAGRIDVRSSPTIGCG